MTERNQINHTAKRYLSPYGRWLRFENRIEPGWPDQYYVLRRISGWCESKLIPASGKCPETFTREQLMWGECEYAVGGRWHLLGLRLSEPAEWWLMTAPQAREWFDGAAPEPAVRASGRFPLREVLDCLAPLPERKPYEMETKCPHCGELVTSRWAPNGGGCLSAPREYVLIADWIYHAACWERQVAENPTQVKENTSG